MNTDQITNLESELPKTAPGVALQVKAAKDPKKVAAGKALARINAEGKKLKQEKDDEISSQVGVSTIYNGIQSIAGIVGTGFTLYHGWKFYESYRKPSHSEPATVAPKVEPKKSLRKSVDF